MAVAAAQGTREAIVWNQTAAEETGSGVKVNECHGSGLFYSEMGIFQSRDRQTFPGKGQIVNSLGFLGQEAKGYPVGSYMTRGNFPLTKSGFPEKQLGRHSWASERDLKTTTR